MKQEEDNDIMKEKFVFLFNYSVLQKTQYFFVCYAILEKNTLCFKFLHMILCKYTIWFSTMIIRTIQDRKLRNDFLNQLLKFLSQQFVPRVLETTSF